MPEFRSRSTSHRSHQRNAARGGLYVSPVVSIVGMAGVILLLIVLFPLDWLRRPEVSLLIDQSVLSPNQDGKFDQVTIIYNLSEQAKVTVQVLNTTGQIVRALVREQDQPAGQHIAAWDGRDQGGIALPDGRYNIVVIAAGPTQSSQQSTPVMIDTTPPPLVVANFAPSQTTRNAAFTVEGTTAPDATVWINDDPFPIAVDSGGIFRATRQLVEGKNLVAVRAVDAAGNETQSQSEVTVRTAAPLLTLTAPAPDSWLRNNIVTVAGSVPEDVKVTVNDQTAVVNERGEFALDVVLQEGDNNIRVTATDPVGNTATEDRVVHIRTRGPTIALNNLPEGLVVTEPSLRVVGQVDPGTTLLVNGSITSVDNRGNFSAVIALQNSSNVVTFVATDRAGNVTTVQRGVTFDLAPGARTGDSLARLVNGETLLRLLAGAALAGIIAFLVIGGRRSLRVELSLNHSTFYPNQPGDERMVGIRIRLSRDARVTMAIYDQMDRRVIMLCEHRPYSAGENQRLWDGQDASGRLLPDGIYQIEATAHAGWSTASSAAWVSLDTSPALTSRARRQSLRSYVPSDTELDD